MMPTIRKIIRDAIDGVANIVIEQCLLRKIVQNTKVLVENVYPNPKSIRENFCTIPRLRKPVLSFILE